MSIDSVSKRSPILRLFTFENIAKLSFFLCLFFLFFGIITPFQEERIEADEYSSNPARQLIFGTIYFLSLFSLLPALEKVFTIIKKEKFVTIFLVYLLLSLLWSNYPDIGFKRWTQVFGGYVVCLSAIVHLKSPQKILFYLRWITAIYLILTFFVVFTIPGASQNYQGNMVWRGFHPHKNLLGQIALVTTIINVLCIKYLRPNYKYLDYLLLFISLLLLVGSRSSTSLVVLILLGIIGFASNVESKLGFGSLSKWFYFSFVTTILTFYISAIVVFPSILEDLFGAMGKDLTFTGRTELWIYVLGIASQTSLLTGVGYGSFWVYGSDNLNKLYSFVIDRPLQSHNGYVDLTIETGLIGFIILMVMTVWYFYNNTKKVDVYYWKYFFIGTILINLQEATLFKQNALTSFMYILAYLILFSRLNNSLKHN